MFPLQNLACKELIITYNMKMASSGDLDQTDFTKDFPYLVFTGKLWDIFLGILKKNHGVIKKFDCTYMF